MLNALRRTSQRARLAKSLYAALISRARERRFYERLGVADSVDGRFDMVVLHAWLVLERLQAAGLQALARSLSDTIFVGFDEALRELGSGDIGMGRRMKKMGDAFNGRLHAYDGARGDEEMAAAILRNVYRGDVRHENDAHCLARYALAARKALATGDPMSGEIEFGPLPVPPE